MRGSRRAAVVLGWVSAAILLLGAWLVLVGAFRGNEVETWSGLPVALLGLAGAAFSSSRV